MKEKKRHIIPTRKGYGFWKEKVDEYENSGLTQKIFCAKKELAISTFKSWLKKIKGRNDRCKKFIPVKIVEDQKLVTAPSVHPGFPQKEEASFYEVRFKNGVR